MASMTDPATEGQTHRMNRPGWALILVLVAAIVVAALVGWRATSHHKRCDALEGNPPATVFTPHGESLVCR
jgi:hypothetical protein